MSEITLRKIDLLPEDHPVLHQEPLTWIFNPPQADPKLMYDIMLENMVYHHGLGLSANQIGMPVKVFAMRIDESDYVIVCFNPEIQKESEEMVMMTEGCLSFPGLFVKVKRYETIELQWDSEEGSECNQKFEGITSRILQHEIDHLNGITFLKRANRFHLEQAQKQLKLSKRRKRNIDEKI